MDYVSEQSTRKNLVDEMVYHRKEWDDVELDVFSRLLLNVSFA